MSGPPEARSRNSPLIDRGRDRLLLGLYQLGWRVAHRLPSRLVRNIIRLMSAAAVQHNGGHVATLRRNLAIISGGEADDDLARRAVASHLRNVFEMLLSRVGRPVRSRSGYGRSTSRWCAPRTPGRAPS